MIQCVSLTTAVYSRALRPVRTESWESRSSSPDTFIEKPPPNSQGRSSYAGKGQGRQAWTCRWHKYIHILSVHNFIILPQEINLATLDTECCLKAWSCQGHRDYSTPLDLRPEQWQQLQLPLTIGFGLAALHIGLQAWQWDPKQLVLVLENWTQRNEGSVRKGWAELASKGNLGKADPGSCCASHAFTVAGITVGAGNQSWVLQEEQEVPLTTKTSSLQLFCWILNQNLCI